MNDIVKKLWRRGNAAAIAGIVALAPPVFGQATTQVTPRIYTLVTNQVLTNGEVLGAATGMPVYAATNTFLPFSGSHAIGLWATVTSTNNVGHSNIIVGLTWAYDTAGGNSNAINGRYGTNFLTTAPWVWTFPANGTTNVTAGTNIVPAVWEPATSLAVAYVSNLCATNITFQLQASIAP